MLYNNVFFFILDLRCLFPRVNLSFNYHYNAEPKIKPLKVFGIRKGDAREESKGEGKEG